MSSSTEREYITDSLWPEFKKKLYQWGTEYRQERDLGLTGEFVGLYKKVRKLKTIIWHGVSERNFREGIRTMLFEIIAHAFLMLYDYDKNSEVVKIPEPYKNMEDPDVMQRLMENPNKPARTPLALVASHRFNPSELGVLCRQEFGPGEYCGRLAEDPIHSMP